MLDSNPEGRGLLVHTQKEVGVLRHKATRRCLLGPELEERGLAGPQMEKKGACWTWLGLELVLGLGQ